MSQAATQTKYLTKVVLFGGQKTTLFSLDGNTWSTRKVELAAIKERHEQQRADLAGKKEELEVVGPAGKLSKVDGDELDTDSDYETGSVAKGKSRNEDDDNLPFSISNEDEDDSDKKREKGRAILRAKASKTAAKLPSKPAQMAFNKNNNKIKVAATSKKKAQKKSEPIAAKAKKSGRATPQKTSVNKKSKSTAAKRKKAA